ncbi:MAG: ABC transporter permease [Rhodobiaceae bacterium]|nr:ABC transporter permease [Rhodobiaceae bacterium]MCC0016544.1 ABC transporter permease [Rhodobiaceae bacterium]MCC0042378.1 ABC transporter permease [Rhodobiaceae bacterium]
MSASQSSRTTRSLIVIWTVTVIAFLYIPMVAVALASFSKQRYFRFPISRWTTEWYTKTFESLSVRDLLWTSLSVAALVTVFSVLLAFFGALAFARYDWKGRKLYQRLVLLPIFFPQAVLGLALLLWFSVLDVTTSWQTAVFAHMIWIVPIVILIMSIQVYSFDPALEEAAFDLGATRWQVLREVTLPILSPGIISGGTFAFLLSWGNFPLSLFTTGADQTVPEWLYAKMVSGYTPMVPTLGTLTMSGAAILILVIYLVWMALGARRRARMATNDE